MINSFLPYIPQELGTDVSTAAGMPVAVNSLTATVATASGVITSPNVTEFVAFQAQAGPASVVVSTLSPWGSTARTNLFLQAVLYAPDGSIVSVCSGAGCTMPNLVLPQTGTYFLAISGVGTGGFATLGFTSYGSRGQWEANVTYVPCTTGCGTPLPTTLAPLPSPSPAPPLPVAQITTIALASLTKTVDFKYCTSKYNGCVCM